MSEAPKILAALVAAQQQIGAVRKGERNAAAGGGYMFRGIDAVVNASSPAFRDRGVVVVPEVLDHQVTQREVGNKRSWMTHVTVRVRYTFHAVEDGSFVSAVTAGEAMDAGDKATPKAMSVALRTALLQALMLPTDEPDPDSFTYGHDDGQQAAPRQAAQDGPEPPSDELVAALLALAPADAKGGAARVAWVKAQAAAHGYDMQHGGQMAALLDELRAEAAMSAAGAHADEAGQGAAS